MNNSRHFTEKYSVALLERYFVTLFQAAERIADASGKTRQLKLDDVYISGILRRKTGTSLYHMRAVYAPNTPFDAPLLAKLENTEALAAKMSALRQQVFAEE